MAKNAKHPVRTTEKSLKIVELISAFNGARLTELASELDMSKSTIYNHLSTLEEHGYTIKEDGVYRLSLKFLNLGGRVRNNMGLYQTAEPQVNRLAEETGELANLMTEELGQGIHLYRAKGSFAIDPHTYAGLRTHLHTTGLGKAMLAHLSESEVTGVIETQGLPAKTTNTITDPKNLLDELDRIRERGYAFDDEEHLKGLRCVAAPIQTARGQALGAISISAPTNRLKGNRFKHEIPDLVMSSANVIELNLIPRNR